MLDRLDGLRLDPRCTVLCSKLAFLLSLPPPPYTTPSSVSARSKRSHLHTSIHTHPHKHTVQPDNQTPRQLTTQTDINILLPSSCTLAEPCRPPRHPPNPWAEPNATPSCYIHSLVVSHVHYLSIHTTKLKLLTTTDARGSQAQKCCLPGLPRSSLANLPNRSHPRPHQTPADPGIL